jgi:hypothetical protein
MGDLFVLRAKPKEQFYLLQTSDIIIKANKHTIYTTTTAQRVNNE